jgi:hypothetical protein
MAAIAPPSLNTPNRIERLTLAVLLIAFVTYGIAQAPLYCLWCLLCFSAAAFVATQLRESDDPSPWEPLLTAALAVMMLFIGPEWCPMLQYPSVEVETSAIFISQLIWAHRRYPNTFSRSTRLPRLDSTVFGLAAGFALGVFFTVVAAVIITIGVLRSENVLEGTMSPLMLFCSYLAGGSVAGTTIGCLWSMNRWPLGVALHGVLGAFFMYGAVGVGMDGFTTETLETAVGIALFAGPAFGLSLRLRGLREEWFPRP